MKVVFDDEALDELRHIYDWIAWDNRRAAENLVTRILDKVEVLPTPGSPKWDARASSLERAN